METATKLFFFSQCRHGIAENAREKQIEKLFKLVQLGDH